MDGSGNILLSDPFNDVVRCIDADQMVSTVAGSPITIGVPPTYADGLGSAALFYGPGGLAVDSSGTLYIADTGNNVIRKALPPSATGIPTIPVEPTSQSAYVGASATFTLSAAGPGPLSYQWYFDGAAIPGATSPTYEVQNATQAMAGSYYCTVTNAAGTTTSY